MFRRYGVDKMADSEAKQSRIVNLCMKDLADSPGLEMELDTSDKIRYFVVQTILSDVSPVCIDMP